MNSFLQFGAVFLGGGIGAVLRYGLSFFLKHSHWPVSTLVANLCGSFLIGFLASALRTIPTGHHVWLFFVTGILGGFTTFSAFQWEILSKIQEGQIFFAAAYIGISVLSGLLLAALGYGLGGFFLKA